MSTLSSLGADDSAGAKEYITEGKALGLTSYFDGLNYIASYGDLIKALGANEQAGATHYINNGNKEARATTFDGLAYIA